VRQQGPARNWRRRGGGPWSAALLQVVDRRLFAVPDDLAALLPPALDEPFTTTDLALAIDQPRWLRPEDGLLFGGAWARSRKRQAGQSVPVRARLIDVYSSICPGFTRPATIRLRRILAAGDPSLVVNSLADIDSRALL